MSEYYFHAFLLSDYGYLKVFKQIKCLKNKEIDYDILNEARVYTTCHGSVIKMALLK